MTVTAPRPLPRFLQQGKASTLDQTVKRAGGAVSLTATGSSYTLYDGDGTAVIDGAAVTIDTDTGAAEYALGSSALNSYDLPQPPTWREKWILVDDDTAEVYTIERDVIVCRVAPEMVIGDEDLIRLHGELRRIKPEGATSHEDVILEAWDQLVGALLADGVIATRTLNPWALRNAHLFLALHLRFNGWNPIESAAAKYERQAQSYLAKYEKAYEKIALRRDDDEDGVADSTTTLEAAEPELFLTDLPDWYGGV